MVAKRYQTEHHEAVVAPDIGSIVGDVVRHHGEPFADSSAVAMFCLAKMTRQHVTVALSGDGADEIFGGYTRYQTARLAHLYDSLPTPIRRAYRSASMAISKAVAPHMCGFVESFPQSEAVRYPYIMCQFTAEEKRALYLAPMRDAATDATTRRFENVLAESAGAFALRRLIDLDWKTYLVDDINVKVDIAAMAQGLEVRCPFLDTKVVEFASCLPARLLMRPRGKYLLRRALASLLPQAILSRSKRGFGLPLRRWMRRDLATMVRDVLLDRTARERGFFDPRVVRQLVDGLGGNDYVAPDRVWTLLMLELWFREFVDRPAPVSR
jgi:asparagine synthase (glutamine-hydrolysing)